MNEETTEITHQIITTDASTSELETHVLHPLQVTSRTLNTEEELSVSESTVLSSPPLVDLTDDQDHIDDNSARIVKSKIKLSALKNKSQSTSNLESMRRRTKAESKSNSSGLVVDTAEEGQYFYQRSQRRSRSMIVERTGSTNYDQNDDYDHPSIVQEPTSHVQALKISDFMSTDKDYVDFLLRGNNFDQSDGEHTARQRVFVKQEHSTPTHLQISNFCTWFSLIAVMILTLFGILIETQPLYIKGISPQRTPYIRVLHVHNDGPASNSIGNSPTTNVFSWVHFSGRLRILDSYREFKNDQTSKQAYLKNEKYDDHEEYITNEYVRQGKDYHERRMSSENIRFEMKKEAKTAFKTAALYFLTMILSIVYTQNHEYIRQHYRQWNLVGRLAQAILLRRYFSIIYNRYKRRNYSDLEGGSDFFPGRIFRGGRNVNVNYGNADVELSLPTKDKRVRKSKGKVTNFDKFAAIGIKDSDEFVDQEEIPTVWDEVLSASKSKKR